MESFQPGLSFSPSDRAKIASRLHSIFTPSKIQVRARMKSQPGMKQSLEMVLYFALFHRTCVF